MGPGMQRLACAEYGGDMRLEDFQNVAVGLINDALANMHTIAIAKVTQVKAKTINCKPVMSRVVNNVKIDLPEFSDVPVVSLQGGSSYLAMPIKKGDYCLLLISERCFDGWYNGQDFERPLEYRMHDYSDSFAIVGINPASSALTIPDIIHFIGDKLMNGNHEHNGDLVHTGNNDHTGDYNQTGNKVQTGNHTQIGVMSVTGSLGLAGAFIQTGGGGAPSEFASPIETPEIDAVDYKAGGVSGISTSFVDHTGKTFTVTKGLITGEA